jgi:cyanophycinase
VAGVRDVFLLGGGREPAQVAEAHGPLLAARPEGPIACLVAGEADEARWQAALGGRARLHRLEDGLPDLGGAAAVYVAGGHTPTYARLLRGLALPEGVPYAGFSAGAAVAAAQAVVGGWRAPDGGAVCPEEAGEDLDGLTVEAGLGLVPFAVDVHAAQWGTLGRLVAAVDAGLAERGVAIDEGTCVHVRSDEVAVVGLGGAWFVTPGQVRRVRATPFRDSASHD